MLLELVKKKDIIKVVKRGVISSRKEILATMLLSEELARPLPSSYHALLKKKVSEGVILKRIGFGTQDEYNKTRQRYMLSSKRYRFRYANSTHSYQRFILVDRKILFFGVDGLFFQSEYKPLIEVFSSYFLKVFKKAKS